MSEQRKRYPNSGLLFTHTENKFEGLEKEGEVDMDHTCPQCNHTWAQKYFASLYANSNARGPFWKLGLKAKRQMSAQTEPTRPQPAQQPQQQKGLGLSYGNKPIETARERDLDDEIPF